MGVGLKPRPPKAGAPAYEWRRFELQCDAVEYFDLKQRESSIGDAIRTMPYGADGRWRLIGDLDAVVTRRIVMENRVRPWLR